MISVLLSFFNVQDVTLVNKDIHARLKSKSLERKDLKHLIFYHHPVEIIYLLKQKPI
jgi:hypothetical protein